MSNVSLPALIQRDVYHRLRAIVLVCLPPVCRKVRPYRSFHWVQRWSKPCRTRGSTVAHVVPWSSHFSSASGFQIEVRMLRLTSFRLRSCHSFQESALSGATAATFGGKLLPNPMGYHDRHGENESACVACHFSRRQSFAGRGDLLLPTWYRGATTSHGHQESS